MPLRKAPPISKLPSRSGIQPFLSYPSDRLRPVRIALECFITFLCFEGLLRRAFPSLNTPLLGFKFIAAPALYLYFATYSGKRVTNASQYASSLLIYLCWGGILAIAMTSALSLTGCAVAIAVNILFVPFFVLGKHLYNDATKVENLCWRFSALASIIALIAFYQCRLPNTHWLVLQTDGDRAIRLTTGLLRVPGSFQFCNTYGSFTAIALVACTACLSQARTSHQRITATGFLTLNLVGGILTGSRLATLGGAGIVIGMLLLAAKRSPKLVVAIVAIGLTGCIFAFLISDSLAFNAVASAGESRSFSTSGKRNMGISDRILEYYFGADIESAIEASNLLGFGWGPYTMGVSRFFPPSVVYNLKFVEGGYARVIAETGCVGIACFLCFLYSQSSKVFRDKSKMQLVGFGLIFYITMGTLPVMVWQISALAVPWWLLLGAYHGAEENERQSTLAFRSLACQYPQQNQSF